MSDMPLPEELDRFLNEQPNLPPPEEMRADLLEQTLGMLPGPFRRRRWLAIAGIAAGVLLAVLATYFGLRDHFLAPGPKKEVVERENLRPPKKPPGENPGPIADISHVDPLQLEWRAFDATEDQKRVRLYFQAGNVYFERHKDFEAALRCYRQALQFAPARELGFDANDNWLVMALKRDYRKEK